jgi:hypothetical protein
MRKTARASKSAKQEMCQARVTPFLATFSRDGTNYSVSQDVQSEALQVLTWVSGPDFPQRIEKYINFIQDYDAQNFRRYRAVWHVGCIEHQAGWVVTVLRLAP